MKSLIIVNAEGPDTRVAVLREGKLVELFIERKRDVGIVGNIYRAKVSRVLPGMDAAFLDLGPRVDRAAFLHASDIVPDGEPLDLSDGGSSRSRGAKIKDLVKPNQSILVQVVKEPVAQKGARVTGYVSLPGRYSVYMPGASRVGVSKRIAAASERKRLRSIVSEVASEGGFVIRTAAETAEDSEIKEDTQYLYDVWKDVEKDYKKARKPGLIYAELDVVLRAVRDLVQEDVEKILVDSQSEFDRVRGFIDRIMPDAVEKLELYTGSVPIFDAFSLGASLANILSRNVPLDTGGSLVIDHGEALTCIDINTGSFVGSSDLEETVTENNLEACKEISRQLRLRNIGGIVVIDFVDMDNPANRRKIWDHFNKAMETDRAKYNVTRLSELGLIEMTRKRTRESLHNVLTEPCPNCQGTGRVMSPVTIAYEILREIARVGPQIDDMSMEVCCDPTIQQLLLEYEQKQLNSLEKKLQKSIKLKAEASNSMAKFSIAGREFIALEPKPEKRPTGKRPAKRSALKRTAAKRSTSKRPAKNGATATNTEPRDRPQAKNGRLPNGRRRANGTSKPDQEEAGMPIEQGNGLEEQSVVSGREREQASADNSHRVDGVEEKPKKRRVRRRSKTRVAAESE